MIDIFQVFKDLLHHDYNKCINNDLVDKLLYMSVNNMLHPDFLDEFLEITCYYRNGWYLKIGNGKCINKNKIYHIHVIQRYIISEYARNIIEIRNELGL